MNILYYLEPQVELGNSTFRFATLKSIIVPESKGLKEHDSNYNIKVVVSEDVYDMAIMEGVDFSHLDMIILDRKSIINVFSDDSYRNSINFYNGNYNQDVSDSFKCLLKGKLGDFEPDLTLTYESNNGLLKQLYPNSLHLNQMFGCFSRPPFPSFCVLDAEGIFGHSFLSKYIDSLVFNELSSDEEDVLKRFRRKVLHNLSKNFPFKKEIEVYKGKFDSLVLLATQIDGYFAFDACTDYQSQYEMAVDVLSKTPENTGVIVTEHGYSEQFNKEQREFIKNTYPNAIFLDKDIPSSSQFLLPYVDGVLTVSSSIGYQSLLWQKPLLVLGDSQISPLSKIKSESEFYRLVDKHNTVNNDVVLYHLISQLHLNYKFDIFDGKSYSCILEELLFKHKQGKEGLELICIKKGPAQVEKELNNSFRGWALDKQIKESSVDIQPDYLKMALCTNKYVSFDLFDTLVERSVFEPYELFYVAEKKARKLLNNKNFDFVYFRRTAEADTRRPTGGKFEVTLDEIYETFSSLTGLSKLICDQIKEIEYQVELDNVKPKRRMIEEFNLTKLINYGTSIITDIYLTQDQIEGILSSCGITDHNILLVSAETRNRKHNGTIYPEYLELLTDEFGDDVKSNRCLHIGDNKTADGDMAKLNGLNCYTFPKATDNYRASAISELMGPSVRTRSLLTSHINGLIANRFYFPHWNYVDKKSAFHGHPFEYGYAAIGPLVTGFAQWLHEELTSDGIEVAYFLSRDGWLFKQAYEQLYPQSNIKVEYLYSSRRAAMVASISSLDDINEIASQSFSERSLEDFIVSRFGLEWSEQLESEAKKFGLNKKSIVSPKFRFASLLKYLESIQDVILSSAKSERESYLDYLDERGFIQDTKDNKAAVIDIGYSGSMQYYLKRMLQLESLPGYYFLTHLHAKSLFDGDIYKGYLANYDDHRNGFRHSLNDHVFIFESALSSPEGSLTKFTGKGSDRVMHLLDAEEEKKRVHLLNDIHIGARAFFSDWYKYFVSKGNTENIPAIVASSIISRYAEYPKAKDAEMFLNFEVENTFGGGSVSLVCDYTKFGVTKDKPLDKVLMDKLIAESKWKQGAKVLFSSFGKNEPQKNNHNTNKVVKPALKVKSNQSRVATKLLKFSNDPYLYARASNNKKLKSMSFLFDYKKVHGRMVSKLSSSMVKFFI
ncbi:capsular polysaccharide export protein, LipB/KpsS family [Vibrio hyugaensis]|uniref:capsular polysaccharide export protein, LipB/KpsS family n=1 Tax=Vibrio hyugaensis TaxID=1534743 RepID=UPI000694EDC8|nr:hypothetical protein [Vibrio hyugaensis]